MLFRKLCKKNSPLGSFALRFLSRTEHKLKAHRKSKTVQVFTMRNTVLTSQLSSAVETLHTRRIFCTGGRFSPNINWTQCILCGTCQKGTCQHVRCKSHAQLRLQESVANVFRSTGTFARVPCFGLTWIGQRQEISVPQISVKCKDVSHQTLFRHNIRFSNSTNPAIPFGQILGDCAQTNQVTPFFHAKDQHKFTAMDGTAVM